MSLTPDLDQLRHGPDAQARASKALESVLWRQLLKNVKVGLTGTDAGAGFAADTFAQVIADAVSGSTGVLPGMPGAMAQAPAPALMSSGFGPRSDPFTGKAAFHGGVDLAAPEGSPIYAARGGTVVGAGARGGYGQAVEIAHDDGTRAVYAHASTLEVTAGQRVEAGARLGEVGQTGRATGPHLHFEVRAGGRPVDPLRALKSYGQRADDLIGKVGDR
jgi:murein DD-endopeptidase MepM/ murein hydrolase activator NlpD